LEAQMAILMKSFGMQKLHGDLIVIQEVLVITVTPRRRIFILISLLELPTISCNISKSGLLCDRFSYGNRKFDSFLIEIMGIDK
jgi:hypothetical protein